MSSQSIPDDPDLEALVRQVLDDHERARARRRPAEPSDTAAQAAADNVVYPGPWPLRQAPEGIDRQSAADDPVAAEAFLTWTASWLRTRRDAAELVDALARLVHRPEPGTGHAGTRPDATEFAEGDAASPSCEPVEGDSGCIPGSSPVATAEVGRPDASAPARLAAQDGAGDGGSESDGPVAPAEDQDPGSDRA